MAWRFTARKGFIKRSGGSAKEKLIRDRAARLRADGYKVRVYKVRG